MESTIMTPRLSLTHMTDTNTDSEHLQWHHILWSDPVCTGWSLRGRTKTLTESQEWMREQITKLHTQIYAVHVTPTSPSEHSNKPITSNNNTLGELIGSVAIRPLSTLDLAPFPPPNYPDKTATHIDTFPDPFPYKIFTLGYAYLEKSWGKGYASEAASALLTAFKAWKAREVGDGEDGNWVYIEATTDLDNPASSRIIEKLGFRKVGWKEGTEKVFLMGEWREPGYWVWGLWI